MRERMGERREKIEEKWRNKDRKTCAHTHTRVRACACQRKPFVGYNCEVMKVGLRGVRGDRSGVCCWRGLSQKPSIGSCHMCVSVPVCVKKIRIAKPFSPLLKTNGSLFCSRNMLRHFQNTNTLMHTHLPVSISKKRRGEKKSVLQFGHHFILPQTSLP